MEKADTDNYEFEKSKLNFQDAQTVAELLKMAENSF